MEEPRTVAPGEPPLLGPRQRPRIPGVRGYVEEGGRAVPLARLLSLSQRDHEEMDELAAADGLVAPLREGLLLQDPEADDPVLRPEDPAVELLRHYLRRRKVGRRPRSPPQAQERDRRTKRRPHRFTSSHTMSPLPRLDQPRLEHQRRQIGRDEPRIDGDV